MSFWKDRSVLVTGAGGFIASHLIELLVAQGACVRGFVRYNSRGDAGLLRLLSPEKLAGIEIFAGDLRDASSVRDAVLGMDTIFHLGALIAIPYSYLHPTEVVETNIIGTLNILEACRTLHPRRIIHTSSSEVYGTALRVPIDEEHPLQGQSPYSASKIGADKLVESYFRSYDVPVATLRPFNTYGPRQSARAVIPAIITQALTSSTIRLGNLEARRDLTYVSDTVNGFLAIGEAENVEGETINLGTGQEFSIRNLAETILSILEMPLQIEIERQRLRPEKSEVQRLLSNNQKAQTILGWKPQVDLRTGLTSTIAYIREHLKSYQTDKYQL